MKILKVKSCLRRIIVLTIELIFRVLIFPIFNPRGKKIDISNPKRILCIRLDRVGDMVLSTPTFRALRNTFPKAHISILANPYNSGMVIECDYLNEIIIYDKNKMYRGLIRKIQFLKELRKRNFDITLDLYTDVKLASAVIAYFTGAPIRVGYDLGGRGFLFTHRLALTKESKHMVEVFLNVARAVGADTIDKKLKINLTSEEREFAAQFLRKNNISQDSLLIGIHPGAVKEEPTKWWKKEGFAQVADSLIKKHQAKVIIMGGLQDVEFATQIKELMKKEPIMAAGETDLRQLAALIEKCCLFICNNTGPLHIAVSLETPTVSIMGPSIPERWRPWGDEDRHIVIRKDLDCSPCNFSRCLRGDHACMEEITAQEVFSACEQQLKKFVFSKNDE